MASEPTMAEQAIRVLVADSSRIHTQLLADALKRDPGLNVIRWDSGLSGLIAIALAQDVDVLAVSCSMEGQPFRGLELVRELLAVRPDARAVVLLDSQEREVVVEAFRSGARGVFSRDGSVESFRKCIHCVHQDQIWASTREIVFALEALAASPKINAFDAKGLSLLSKREIEVVRCLAQGLTNREIAERMGLSQHTIKNYLFRVFDKLGVSSRVELLFMTLSQNGNVEEPLAQDSRKRMAGIAHDESALAFLRKAAEAGLPSAQVALAQTYLSRQQQPEDPVRAYTWYLVATQRLSGAQQLITGTMTPAQIEEAQREAGTWLSRLSQTPLLGD